MTINLYSSRARYNLVNKASKISLIKSIDGVPLGEFSILRPVFTIDFGSVKGSFAKLNYCYIPEFERYYFCKVTMLDAETVKIECEVDVWMSHGAQIRGLECLVKRNEFNNNMDLVDNDIPTFNQQTLVYRMFPTQFFTASSNTSGRSIVLVTTGAEKGV